MWSDTSNQSIITFYQEKRNHLDDIHVFLLQNIKKKDAAGAKLRPMGGGLLPPPPGAKAGGVIPPPGGQQTVPAVHTNTGDHTAFVSKQFL